MSSLTGTLYIGITGDLYKRVCQHKAGEIEGFSQAYACVRLVYYEAFDDVRKALAREKQLKRWRRDKKIALIEKMNPRWQDLAETWGHEILVPGQRIVKTPRASMAKDTTSGSLDSALNISNSVEFFQALRSG